MERLICLFIGYAFGLFQTGYIYGRTKHIDIRKEGSGNAGTTNALRTMGKKAGAITLLGDCFKCILAVLLVRFIFKDRAPDMLPLLSMYAGAGAVLGHNYPFYLKFKGGKGIAATAGLVLSTTNIWTVLVCLVAFVAAVAWTKYVSVGSLLVVTLYLAAVIINGQLGQYRLPQGQRLELYGVALLLLISAIFQHRDNIRRLLNGTENKLSFGQKTGGLR